MTLLKAPAPSPASAPKAERATARGNRNQLSKTVTIALLTISAVYFLLPVYWLLVASTKSQAALTKSNGLWFDDFSLFENLGRLFTIDDGRFPRWIMNSLIYAVGGAAVATLLATMAGYALAKFVFRGRQRLFELVIAGVLVPATAISLPLYLMLSYAQLTNTYWAVLLPSFVSPFGVYLARIFAAEGVPDELIEAARIDGASETRIFFQIALRLMGPAMVTVFLVLFVGNWNDFFLSRLVLQDPDLFPITVGLFNWNLLAQRNEGMQALIVTGSMVSVVPLIVLFLALQRYWRSGLTAGALR